MVIVNYQQFIREKIKLQLQGYKDKRICSALSSQEFEQLVIKLYQYCEELNIIKRRIEKLKFATDKNEIIMPKLIDSEITRIDSKAKQIGTAYSLFLIGQRKFKVLSDQAKYYESILKLIITISVEKCFNKEDSSHLTKQVNRLFRTNTFNTSSCWQEFLLGAKEDDSLTKSKKKQIQTNFRMFRRQVSSERSQIKPYVNNQSCYRSLLSRSPIISLWHPNSEFLEFTLAKKNRKRIDL